ncbi:MAG: hypothetical protein R6W76_18965 [Caldilinea sp.]
MAPQDVIGAVQITREPWRINRLTSSISAGPGAGGGGTAQDYVTLFPVEQLIDRTVSALPTMS